MTTKERIKFNQNLEKIALATGKTVSEVHQDIVFPLHLEELERVAGKMKSNSEAIAVMLNKINKG